MRFSARLLPSPSPKSHARSCSAVLQWSMWCAAVKQPCPGMGYTRPVMSIYLSRYICIYTYLLVYVYIYTRTYLCIKIDILTHHFILGTKEEPREVDPTVP